MMMMIMVMSSFDDQVTYYRLLPNGLQRLLTI